MATIGVETDFTGVIFHQSCHILLVILAGELDIVVSTHTVVTELLHHYFKSSLQRVSKMLTNMHGTMYVHSYTAYVL